MSQIDQFLHFAIQKNASDIHFSSDEATRFRIDGDLVALDVKPITGAQLQSMVFEILSEEEQSKLLKEKNLDKRYSVTGLGHFRINIFYNHKGMAVVMRSIPSQIPSVDTLGLPDAIKKIAEKPRGLILVTGPTGSGKSTTLAALIDYLNSNFPYHILTIEDPIEFLHNSKRALINQREIGNSCPSFQEALKNSLREDPDVILIGELRDLETISLALTAAETGHLVFGTLHTRGAAASIDRMIDSFPSGQQSMIRSMISDSLLAVVSQSLIKRADGKGRVAAFEIMVVNNAISNLIREGKVFQMEGVIQTGKKDGMMLMEQSLMALISQGLITHEEAAPYFKNPQNLPNKGAAPAPAPKPQAAAPLPFSKEPIKVAEDSDSLEAYWQVAPDSESIEFSSGSEETVVSNVIELPNGGDASIFSVEEKNPPNEKPKTKSAPPPLKKKVG